VTLLNGEVGLRNTEITDSEQRKALRRAPTVVPLGGTVTAPTVSGVTV
jgi:hypothetical protein